MHCYTKGREEKFFWKKQKYDIEKEKEQANVPEETYHDKIFFGDYALA